MRKITLLSKLCLVLVLIFVYELTAHSNRVQFKPVPEASLSNIVGSVEGECCKPGNRQGCDINHFSCTPCPLICTNLSVNMNCTDASCQPGEPTDVCSTKSATVGLNECVSDGNQSSAGCNIVNYPDGFTCWDEISGLTVWPAGLYQEHRCPWELGTKWNEPGHATATRTVCDGGNTCSVTYALCEG